MADDPYAGFADLAEKDPYAAFADVVPQAGAVQPAAANPFNRQLGADVSYGEPLVPPPTVGERIGSAYLGGTLGQLGALKGASRGLEANLPFVDRAVAAAKANLPQGYGGTGQPYAETLPAEQAKNAAFAQQNPATNAVAGVAAAAPLATMPGLGGGPLWQQALKFGLLGAGASGLEGVSGAPDLTNLSDVGWRGALGAGTGLATGAATPYVGAAVSKAFTPLVSNANRMALVNLLRGAEVPVSAGEVTGSAGLQGLERQGFGAGGAAADQAKAFTKGLMEQGGLPASDATQPSIAKLDKGIGDTFDALSDRNAALNDNELQNKVLDAVVDYHRLAPTPASGVEDEANNILYHPDPTIPGDLYSRMRSDLGKKAWRLSESDPSQAEAYRTMQRALDDSMERSMAANNPDDLGAFRQVRRQYGNLQDISKAAAPLTGEDAVQGTIPPTRMQTVLSSGGRAADYAAGKGDLAMLTRAGVGIMQPRAAAPTGGLTPYVQNYLAHALAHSIGLGGAGYYAGGLPGAALGAGIGAFGGPIAGTAARIPLVRSYLANQVMSRPLPALLKAGGNRALLAAALAAQRHSPQGEPPK
jgi:hypothetical protein